MRYFIGALIVLVLFFAGSLAYRLGVHKSVEMSLTQEGPYLMLYKEHRGAYHKTAPVIGEVETWAKAHQLDCHQTFGQYFDHPELVEESRLRSYAGCVVTASQESFLSLLEKNPPPPDYKNQSVEKRKYVKAIFSGSPAIGPWKVYSKAEQYMREGRLVPDGAVIEIYEIQSPEAMTTTYLFPVKNLEN
jgi:effector-binding domain-containing protein